MNHVEHVAFKQQVELLADPDRQVFHAACKVLADAGKAGREAVLQGLGHPDLRVRRGCADFMDHHSTHECVEPLRQTIQHDEVASVRQKAVHSLVCQRCKAVPLQVDAVAILLECVASDRNSRVRSTAISGLCGLLADARVAPVLKRILQEETQPKLLRAAHEALQWHDPAYRQEVIEHAKARARKRRKRTAS